MVDFANKYINKPVEVLVESKGVGLTSNFIRCQLNGKIGETKLICAKFVNNSGELIE
jgi:hypothetical protein